MEAKKVLKEQLSEDEFKQSVPVDQQNMWKKVTYGHQRDPYDVYIHKTEKDIKNEKVMNIYNEMNEKLKEFMEKNAQKYTSTDFIKPEALPINSIQTDRGEYYFFEQSLYDKYKAIENKYKHEMAAIVGGKSKKKTFIYQKKSITKIWWKIKKKRSY